jgi:predicted metal-binding membrane protein
MSTIAPVLQQPRRGAPRLVLWAIAAAWAIALAAELSGRSGALHRHTSIEGGPPLWAALLLFLVAWQAMVVAMMLPSSLPLIRLFEAVSGRQERASLARAAFLGGYAVIWTGFGAVAFLGDVGLYRALDAVPWLAERPWLVAGGVLGLAGVFQFSDLKDQCLSKCRMPGPYLLAHYRRGAGAAFRLGSGHGIFCLGCCWALMLVMFVAGVAVLWWMAALTALMVYEKVGRHGTTVARVAGVVLLGAAALVLARPTWLPEALGGPKPFTSDVTVGPGPAGSVLRVNGYELGLRLDSNRAARPGTVLVHLSRGKRAVNGARVRATFTMLDMEMVPISTDLLRTGVGTYGALRRPLGMAGRWGVRLDVAPRHGRAFSVQLVDRVRY